MHYVFTRLTWTWEGPLRAEPPHLNVRKAHPHDKVAAPIAEAGQRDGSRTGALTEELCHNEPRDRPRANLEEADEKEDGHHAHIAHPGVGRLWAEHGGNYKLKKKLSPTAFGTGSRFAGTVRILQTIFEILHRVSPNTVSWSN